MSRYYEMNVQISGFNKDKKDTIVEAAREEWDGFEDWEEQNTELHSIGDGNLCGGESEEDFQDRLNKAIVKANGGPCKVNIHQKNLEN
jgi:hypothetical protein